MNHNSFTGHLVLKAWLWAIEFWKRILLPVMLHASCSASQPCCSVALGNKHSRSWNMTVPQSQSLQKKEHQPKSSLIQIPTFWSLLYILVGLNGTITGAQNPKTQNRMLPNSLVCIAPSSIILTHVISHSILQCQMGGFHK